MNSKQHRIQKALKRVLDVLIAGTALLVLSPLILLLSLLIRLTTGAPVFFRHQRPGYRAKIFTCYKFRTMTEARDEEGNLLPDDQRLTRVGKFMRSLSLDELPQLFNVLKGDMSLVGPRPLLIEYLKRYTPEQARRHEAKPGITGLAQVKGRNALLFSQRLAYDIEYVDHFSLWLDVKILLLTALKLFFRRLEDRAGQHVSVVDDLGLHRDSNPTLFHGGNPSGARKEMSEARSLSE